MKITIDPMSALRKQAEDRIEAMFNVEASCNVCRDQEHAAKRLAAKAVLAGGVVEALEVEAEITNTTANELAAVILSKPDNVLERGVRRRKMLLDARSAKTPAELDAIF